MSGYTTSISPKMHINKKISHQPHHIRALKLLKKLLLRTSDLKDKETYSNEEIRDILLNLINTRFF